MIDYTLTRSKRKTIAIHIRDGGVEVRAPMRVPVRDIEGFIASKEAWIADKLSESRRRMERREIQFGLWQSYSISRETMPHHREGERSACRLYWHAVCCTTGLNTGAAYELVHPDIPLASQTNHKAKGVCARAADVGQFRFHQNHRGAKAVGQLFPAETAQHLMAVDDGR